MILFVCEGNVCRSVLAAGVLQKALGTAQGVTVGSAGTNALVGEAADPVTAGIAARHGISLEGHRARQLTPDLLAAADMVVSATRQIRSTAVQTYPPSVKYSFTIRQLARILKSAQAGFDAGGLTGSALVIALARSVNQEKGRLIAPQGDDDNIADPRGRPLRVQEASAEAVIVAVDELAKALGGTPVPWTPARGTQRWEIPKTATG
jgi:protein-tyrosine phosphatase